MFTVHPHVQMKQEGKHTLPPLSHIISNVLPHHIPQNQHHNPIGPCLQQIQTAAPQIPTAALKMEFFPSTPSSVLTSTQSSTNSSISSASSISSGFSFQQTKCSCKQEGTHIPRPRNAFILFRQQHHQSVLDEGDSVKTNPDVSRELGKRWRDLLPKEKEYWNKLAEEEKKKHAEKYPGYRYIPRRFGKKNKCSFCKSRAYIKEVDAHEQRLRLLDLQEQELKSKLASYQVKTSASQSYQAGSHPSPHSNSAPNTPDDSTKLYNSASSEEHAIAQSFLSLRDQPQHYYPKQQYLQQGPVQTSYFPPNGQVHLSQYPPQPHHHYLYTQNVQLSSINGDVRRVSQSSQDDKHKAGSIASFLN